MAPFIIFWLIGWSVAVSCVKSNQGSIRIGDFLVTFLAWPMFLGFVLGQTLKAAEQPVIIVHNPKEEDKKEPDETTKTT